MLPAIFALIPARVWLIGAAAVAGIACLLWVRSALIEQGRADATSAITRANEAAEAKADAGERRVLNCPPGHWNKETDRCEQ